MNRPEPVAPRFFHERFSNSEVAMSLRHRVLFTSCLVVSFALNAGTAQAGLMEGIVDQVFKTAEKEFLAPFTRDSRSTSRAPQRQETRSPARDPRATQSPGAERRTWLGSPRLFRSR
jgi:hypothetical protein